MTSNRKIARLASILAAAAVAAATQGRAQQVANPPSTTRPATTTKTASATTTDEADEEVVKLTPFEVSAGSEQGYNAASTLAGNRLNTELRDIGNAVSVVTKQFLTDTGAVDNKTLLQYLPNGEVGSTYGNFAGTGDGATPDESGKWTNPNQNTRVRGLTAADNTRDFFLTNVPWDGYNIDRVDFQRGPNSILFGQGSPAGIINAGTQQAGYKNSGQFDIRLGSFGSNRQVLNINRVILPNELAFRLAFVRNDEQFKQDPAYSLDKRMYAATRYEPSFLKKGGARTVLKANIEFGDIRSNQPRNIPPFDLITPWFQTGTYKATNVQNQPTTYAYLNRQTFNSQQLQDDNTGTPNHGQMRPSINGGPNAGQPNPSFNPWIGNFGQQFGGALFTYTDNSPALQRAVVLEPNSFWGINTAGARDGSAYPYVRPGGIAPYSTFATNARLEWWAQGLYKDKSLTDPSVFDFYNNLLDGPNKKEWQNFRVYNISLAQTFFDDQIGIEGVYNKEWWKGGQKGIFSSWKQSIAVDIMNVYSDGTAANGIGDPTKAFVNGTPNPNVGRPYVTDNGAFTNNQRVQDRESGRLTAFARHDFARDGFLPKVLGTVLGQHTITGLWAEDRQNSDQRSWQRWGTDDAYRDFLGYTTNSAGVRTYASNFNSDNRRPNVTFYLGPTLINRSTAFGANIPRMGAEIDMPKTANVYLFDSHWNKPTDPSAAGYVNPAAPWTNGYYPSDLGGYVSTQSENPANYVGWVNKPVNIISADDSAANQDLLTTNARLSKTVVKSKALVWQGHFWKNFLVGTAGIRKDTARGWSTSMDPNVANRRTDASGKILDPEGHLDLSSGAYRIYDTTLTTAQQNQLGLTQGAATAISVTSKSWSLVAHLTDLWENNLPVRVSVFMAKSKNFQPFSNRVDLYGHSIGAPEGKTTEEGVLFETRDNKYSLKINKYKTESTLQDSSALNGTWFIGSGQAWAANWVNKFEFNWTQDTIQGAVTNDPTNSNYNYGQAPGETLEQAQAREAKVITAWRAWQKSINPDFYKAWNINLNDPTKSVTASTPSGFAVTEDSISEGYELELNAQPTRNWRVSLNASKTDARRTNIGGAALTDFVTKYEAALAGGAPGTAGDLRIWWGGAGNETTLLQWNNNIGSEYHQRKLQEGTNVPELRKWRYNAITNYDFDTGILKGVGVGGGLRYQSDVVIGYRPFWIDANDHSKGVSYDMANPFKGPAETSIDLWVSYRRKLTEKIEWSVQFNVRDVNHGGDALIPINVQPDGGPAAYRIRPPRTWQLTNSFRF